MKKLVIFLISAIASIYSLAITPNDLLGNVYVGEIDLSSIAEAEGMEAKMYLYFPTIDICYVRGEVISNIGKEDRINEDEWLYKVENQKIILYENGGVIRDSSGEWHELKDVIIGELTEKNNGQVLISDTDSFFATPNSKPIIFNILNLTLQKDRIIKSYELRNADHENPNDESDYAEKDNMVINDDMNSKSDLSMIPVSDEEEIFTAVEQKPEFPGGQGALMKWLSQNVRYPETAQQDGIQGRAVVKLLIEKDGTISNAEIARSTDNEALDKEALRVVKKMPKWQPALNNGIAVRSYYMLPVTFKQ